MTLSDMDAWSDGIDSLSTEIETLDRIYNVISKVTILSVILIMAAQLVMIASVISWFIKDYSNLCEDNIWIVFAVYDWFKIIHIFTASLCIFLGFEFTKNWYQYCGYKCHNKTKQYCIKKINQKMNDYNKF